MRKGLAPFFAGVIVMVLAFVGFQQWVIRTTTDDISYRFINYIFEDTAFPWSYLDNGRVMTRFLFPMRIKVTYYDAQYNEVTSAEKPGRYGAIARIGLNGGVDVYRYITLYRTPKKIFWGDGPGKIPQVILPEGTGIDPQVEQNQQAEIGEAAKNAFFATPDAAIVLAGLSETAPNDPAVDRLNPYARDSAWWYGLRKKLGLTTKYRSTVDVPEGYDPAKKWPLILSLHSNAGAGSDLHLVRDFELPGHIKNGLKLPAIVIAPQCPRSEYWQTAGVIDFLDEMMAKYSVDPDRVYLVGDSGGGDTAMALAALHPEKFAAVTTIAGEGDVADAARLKDLPYWGWVGEKDNLVMPSNVSNMVEAVNKAGGHAHFTLVPGSGHAAWDKAFETDALFTWLLAQKRGQPEVLTPGVP